MNDLEYKKHNEYNKKNNKTIFLIGLPGCGKSSLSEMLADKLNYKLYDLDSIIEKRENRSISDIFNNDGETYFRNIETCILDELSSINNGVISTGGGIVCSEKNRKIMKEKGLAIFIDRKAEIILNNIDESKRPLLANNKNKLLELSKQRDSLYRESADIIFTYNSWDSSIEDTFLRFYDFIKEYL